MMKALGTDIGTIHFVGIGGIGMSGIAEVLHNLGYAVQGSDIADSANVRRLREAWRGGPDAATQTKAQAGTQAAVPEDTAYVRADDNQTRAVRGVALGVEGDSFNFRFNDKDRKIALDRLAGVVFGEGEDEKADAFDRSFHQSVLLASGDSLSGVWVGLAAGALELRTPWDANVSIPLEKVTKLKSRNGRLVYLMFFMRGQPAQA